MRADGLVIEKVRVPLGVVGSHLRGSAERHHRRRCAHAQIGKCLHLAGFANGRQHQPGADRPGALGDRGKRACPSTRCRRWRPIASALREFIAQPGAADVVIPRGGEELKHFLLDNSRIPVLAAAGGNNHVYVDATADAAMAEAIAVNSKIQRPGVCNSAETLLVHRDRAELMESITAALRDAGRGDRRGRRGLGHRVSRYEDGRSDGRLTGRRASITSPPTAQVTRRQS